MEHVDDSAIDALIAKVHVNGGSQSLEGKLVKRAARNLGLTSLFSYRQFNADHLKSLVQDGTIRFSNPATFNDPWECRPLYSLSTLDSEEGRERTIKWMQRAVVDQAKRDGIPQPGEEAMKKQAEELRGNPSLLRTLVEQNTEEIAKGLRAEYRIFCMTKTADDPLMWSHYTDHHRGLCLQFRTDSVFQDAYRVDYSCTYPEIDIADNDDYAFVIASLLTKAKAWAYENEFRSINKEGGMEGYPECHDGFVSIPRECLQGIIVGCQIHDDSRKIVEQLVSNAGRKIDLLEASLVPGHYKLEIKKL